GPGTARVAIEVLRAGNGPAGPYTVQVGAFAEKENALRLMDRLKRDYLDVVMVPHETPRGTLFRVRIGAENDERKIQKVARRLERNGYTTLITRKD
ncbi:MAG: SPOR domain-containing protein, partial [Nitrospirae bacterium]|nr:SPOR domain-containing protein [Nitrospirota bacterium]